MKTSVFSRRLAVLSVAVGWASFSVRGAAAMGKSLDAPVLSRDLAAIKAIRKLEGYGEMQ
jgi:hypothetical protein